MRSVLLCLSLTILTTKVWAWCREPSISFLSTPIKPITPWCLDEYNKTHTCDEWEIARYYSQLENYRSEVSSFAYILNNYVDEAIEYAKCRASELE